MGGACGAYGGGERCAQGSSGEPEGTRPLGGPRRRWEDNIKMDLREVGGDGDWMEMAGTCVCGDLLSVSIKCREFHD